ncbi:MULTISPECIES: glycosyltransferase family 2 protein [Exiguobacterium]|uniref:Glycosyltransferase family 2 protein n=1 Tax=Exiguobacterium antarcticum TaxID=132920 RepID=A0ABT6R2M1_9BACL|nr:MULTISPECIES: glycosyltransferase family 2 protein [Exiguobacterium]MCT4779255.1 glycosyltransferase family 2 protein [Exiguobacterium soli]MDI3235068.1 glycosyltransferase family 2 protein [Exiguobacterium antarcticum]
MKKIVVFLPAHNEEISLPLVLKRIPTNIDGLPVETIVIDDGSTDATSEIARQHGAIVYRFEHNHGLGAAVREGLRQSYQHGATVAVMIDADNEYPADQIPDVVRPILLDEADYVFGSRFLGTVDGMRLYRYIGNHVFTWLQCVLLKRRIYDGQSGMRAFSRAACKHAEIIHDYNYAQVLTLNLVRKGFRLHEVPIRYRVREAGKSFIRLNYIQRVLPAIYREWRRPIVPLSSEERFERKEHLG